jgi:predicted DNA-binding transcriptional regulator AlpA
MRESIMLSDRELVSAPSIIKRLGISYETMYRWIPDVLPPPIRIGKRLYFDKDEVENRILLNQDSK